MAKEWTDEEVTAEIQQAIKIFREDHVVKSLGELKSLLAKPGSNDDSASGDDTSGNPPPAKEPKDSTVKPKKSLWWGE